MDGREIDLGGKASADVKPGVRLNVMSMVCLKLICTLVQEVFCLETPGGGGFGDPNLVEVLSPPVKRMRVLQPAGSVADYTMLQESSV